MHHRKIIKRARTLRKFHRNCFIIINPSSSFSLNNHHYLNFYTSFASKYLGTEGKISNHTANTFFSRKCSSIITGNILFDKIALFTTFQYLNRILVLPIDVTRYKRGGQIVVMCNQTCRLQNQTFFSSYLKNFKFYFFQKKPHCKAAKKRQYTTYIQILRHFNSLLRKASIFYSHSNESYNSPSLPFPFLIHIINPDTLNVIARGSP